MTNQEKLKEKVQKMFDQGMKNIHFSLDPEYYDWKITEDGKIDVSLNKVIDPEELAAEKLLWIEAMEKRHNLSIEEKMKDDLKTIYSDVRYAFEMVSYDRIAKYRNDGAESSIEELHRRLRTAWAHLDFALLHIGNWLTLEERKLIDKTHVMKQFEVNKSFDLVSNKEKYQ